jgi:hypothetical protein
MKRGAMVGLGLSRAWNQGRRRKVFIGSGCAALAALCQLPANRERATEMAAFNALLTTMRSRDPSEFYKCIMPPYADRDYSIWGIPIASFEKTLLKLFPAAAAAPAAEPAASEPEQQPAAPEPESAAEQMDVEEGSIGTTVAEDSGMELDLPASTSESHNSSATAMADDSLPPPTDTSRTRTRPLTR